MRDHAAHTWEAEYSSITEKLKPVGPFKLPVKTATVVEPEVKPEAKSTLKKLR